MPTALNNAPSRLSGHEASAAFEVMPAIAHGIEAESAGFEATFGWCATRPTQCVSVAAHMRPVPAEQSWAELS